MRGRRRIRWTSSALRLWEVNVQTNLDRPCLVQQPRGLRPPLTSRRKLRGGQEASLTRSTWRRRNSNCHQLRPSSRSTARFRHPYPAHRALHSRRQVRRRPRSLLRQASPSSASVLALLTLSTGRIPSKPASPNPFLPSQLPPDPLTIPDIDIDFQMPDFSQPSSGPPSPTARPRSESASPSAQVIESSPLPSISDALARPAPSSSSASSPRSRTLSPPAPLPTEDDAALAAQFAVAAEPETGGRTFRKRTVAQLNPYMYDQLRYAKKLTENQWEDAIVSLPKPKVLDAPREGKGKEKGRDDLDGWLDLEDGEGEDRGEGGSGWRRRGGGEEESSDEEEDEDEDEELGEDEIGMLPERRHAKPRKPKGALDSHHLITLMLT